MNFPRLYDPDGPQVRIGAFIDPSGAVVGGEQVAAEVDKVAAKTEAAGERVNSSVLGNLRSVHHLVGGLIEMGEGGPAAFAGIAAEGRVATEVFEGMLGPLAPILLILTTITQIAIPMFEAATEKARKAQEEQNKAMEEANRKADERKDKHVEVEIKKEADAVRDLAAAYNATNSELERQAAGERAYADNRAAELKATKDLTLAQLEQQKQKELAGAHGEGERNAIEDKYKGLAAEVEGKSDAEIAKLKQHAAQVEIDVNNQERDQIQQQINSLGKQKDELQKKADETAAKAALQGVTPDEEGSFGDAYKEAREENHAAVKKANDAIQQGASPELIDLYQTQIQPTITKVRAAYDADMAQRNLAGAGGDLQKSIDKLSEKIDGLATKHDQLVSAQTVAGTEEKVAETKAASQKIDDDQKAKSDAAQAAFTDREAKRKEDMENLDAKMKGTTDVAIKSALQGQKTGIEAEGIRDKAKTEYGVGNLSDARYHEEMNRAQAMTTGANASSQVKAQQSQDKTLDREIETAKKQIEASGNKSAIEGLHQITATVLDKVKELAELQALLTAAVTGKLSVIDQQMATTRALANALKDGSRH
jgi:hypothetical protein